MKKALLRWKAVTVTSRIPVYQEEEEEEEEGKRRVKRMMARQRRRAPAPAPAPAPYVQVVPFKGIWGPTSRSAPQQVVLLERNEGQEQGASQSRARCSRGLAKQMQEEEEEERRTLHLGGVGQGHSVGHERRARGA